MADGVGRIATLLAEVAETTEEEEEAESGDSTSLTMMLLILLLLLLFFAIVPTSVLKSKFLLGGNADDDGVGSLSVMVLYWRVVILGDVGGVVESSPT